MSEPSTIAGKILDGTIGKAGRVIGDGVGKPVANVVMLLE